MNTSFKEAFCKHCDVPVARYEKEIIRRTLRPHAARIWPLLEVFGGKTVFSSRQLAGMVAETVTREDFIDVINEYHKDFRPHASFAVRSLKIGVSCRKLLELHDNVRRSDATSVHQTRLH